MILSKHNMNSVRLKLHTNSFTDRITFGRSYNHFVLARFNSNLIVHTFEYNRHNFALNNSVLWLSYNYIFRSYNNIDKRTLWNIVHSYEFTTAKSYFHMSCHNTFENVTFTDKVSYKRILWLIIYILRRTNLLYPAF